MLILQSIISKMFFGVVTILSFWGTIGCVSAPSTSQRGQNTQSTGESNTKPIPIETLMQSKPEPALAEPKLKIRPVCESETFQTAESLNECYKKANEMYGKRK